MAGTSVWLAFNSSITRLSDQQVGEKIAHGDTVVLNRDGFLAFDFQSRFTNYMCQGLLINRFQKARPKRGVDFHRAADNFFRQFLLFHFVILLILLILSMVSAFQPLVVAHDVARGF